MSAAYEAGVPSFPTWDVALLGHAHGRTAEAWAWRIADEGAYAHAFGDSTQSRKDALADAETLRGMWHEFSPWRYQVDALTDPSGDACALSAFNANVAAHYAFRACPGLLGEPCRPLVALAQVESKAVA